MDAADSQILREVFMKKSLSLVFFLILICGSLFPADGRIIFNIYGDGINVPENDFTDQESLYKVFFEAKAAVKVWTNLYGWASYGYLPIHEEWTGWNSKNSFEKDIQVERRLGKRVISGGLGYYAGFLQKDQFAVRLDVGVCSITNRVEKETSALDTRRLLISETAQQSALGLRGTLAFTYGFYKNFFAELSGGYLYAVDTIDDVKTNLGGWVLQVGLGINL
jgi:hypothetical protein